MQFNLVTFKILCLFYTAVKAETFKIQMQVYPVGYCFYKLEFDIYSETSYDCGPNPERTWGMEFLSLHL